jgi:hypothetical protein
MLWFLLSLSLAGWLFAAPDTLPDLFILGGLDFHLRFFAAASIGVLFAVLGFINFGVKFFQICCLALIGFFIWMTLNNGSMAFMGELIGNLQKHTGRAAATHRSD